jgi:predicted acetylornithine/succinylornithine family transaminase
MVGQEEIVHGTNEYLIPNYGRLPLAVASAQGAGFTDADGRDYIDLFPGFGMCGVAGHSHPQIVQAVTAQMQKVAAHGNLMTNWPQVKLAETITRHGFGGKVFYCHSGAEANEAALKLARLAAGEGRYKIISFHGCFHGRTMGALSLTPEKFQKGFSPMLPGNVKVPYGDIDALREAVDDETAGICLEPIQGEGGVNIPSRQFMQDVRKLCDDKKLSMIVDEVWTAPGRTGKWFAYQHFDVTPDIMCLGKAIGGSLPLAAMVAGPALQDVLQPGTHGCTGGGNPVCAAAGLAAMELIEQEDLLNSASSRGGEIMRQIRQSELEIVADVRGLGLMIGIELTAPGKEIFQKCLQRGLIINCTQEKILRLAPPLTINDDELVAGMDILLDVLRG